MAVTALVLMGLNAIVGQQAFTVGSGAFPAKLQRPHLMGSDLGLP